VMNGNHDFVASEVDSDKLLLGQDITEEWSEGGVDPYLTVKVPYLNAGERFEIQIFFDGDADQCAVYCRMEDVTVKLKELGYDDVIGIAGLMVKTWTPLTSSAVAVLAKAIERSIKR
jgi:hypothetical protein